MKSKKSLATCQMTTGEYRCYGPCGNKAKWVDPKSGKMFCGTHRNMVDRYNDLHKHPRCVFVDNKAGRKE